MISVHRFLPPYEQWRERVDRSWSHPAPFPRKAKELRRAYESGTSPSAFALMVREEERKKQIRSLAKAD